MAQSSYITGVINSVIEAMRKVISLDFERGAPKLVENFIEQTDMSVLVGVIGELSGRLVIEAKKDVFITLAERMFGASVTGEILESFVGEFGNMIAGNTALELSNNGLKVNISPPTILSGHTRLSGFDKGIMLPFNFPAIGELRVIVVVEYENSLG